jgi:putative tryptophan/tyrosine transport system substrate-binding protein
VARAAACVRHGGNGQRTRSQAIYMEREHADAGGLITYEPSMWSVHRQAALPARDANGAKPAVLRLQQPTTFELVINLKTAKALGLTVPASILAVLMR